MVRTTEIKIQSSPNSEKHVKFQDHCGGTLIGIQSEKGYDCAIVDSDDMPNLIEFLQNLAKTEDPFCLE